MQLIGMFPNDRINITCWIRDADQQKLAARWEMTATGDHVLTFEELVTRIDIFNVVKVTTVIWCHSTAHLVRNRVNASSQRPAIFTRNITVRPERDMTYRCTRHVGGFPELDNIGKRYTPAFAVGTAILATIVHWRRYSNKQDRLVNVFNSDIQLYEDFVDEDINQEGDENEELPAAVELEVDESELNFVPEAASPAPPPAAAAEPAEDAAYGDPRLNPANFHTLDIVTTAAPALTNTVASTAPTPPPLPQLTSPNLNNVGSGWNMHDGRIVSVSPNHLSRLPALSPRSKTNSSIFRAGAGRSSMLTSASPSRRLFTPAVGNFFNSADAVVEPRPPCPDDSIMEEVEPNILAGVPRMPADKRAELAPMRLTSVKLEKISFDDGTGSGNVLRSRDSAPPPAHKKPRTVDPEIIQLDDSQESTTTSPKTGENSGNTDILTQQDVLLPIKAEPVTPLDLSYTPDPLAGAGSPDPTDSLIEHEFSDDEDDTANDNARMDITVAGKEDGNMDHDHDLEGE